MKSFPLASLRRASLVIGAVWFSAAMAPLAQAADQQVQQLALANTQARDSGKVIATQHAARAQRAHSDVVQAKPARRSHEARTVAAARDIDGSRFVYDSCGCSND